MSDKPEVKERIDQRLQQEAQLALEGILGSFPELRAAILILDYDLLDPGSLPAGVWLPARNLKSDEVLRLCKQIDKVGHNMRAQHDGAVSKHIIDANDRVKRAEERVAELTKRLEQLTSAKE